MGRSLAAERARCRAIQRARCSNSPQAAHSVAANRAFGSGLRDASILGSGGPARTPTSLKSRKKEKMAEIAVEAPEIPAQLPLVRVAVLGAGKMGGILLQ